MTGHEKKYLKELAKRQLELANTEKNLERKKRWYKHNRGEITIPPIVMEMSGFEREILPVSQCESIIGKKIEHELQSNIVNYEKIDDDKVVPDYFRYYFSPDICEFSMKIPTEQKKTGAMSWKHPIKDLEEDWYKIEKSSYSFNRKKYNHELEEVYEVIGDVMPICPENVGLYWRLAPSSKVFDLMGMENMMISFYDYPERMKELYQFIVDDMKEYIAWEEKEGLLTANNGNQIAGSGSYGFSDELHPEEKVLTKDMWGFISSQETVSISADMYHEFLFESYYQLAEIFGKVYYGCCEPAEPIWEKSISKLPNLKKVSISPFCNEDYMGEVLRGENIIYSRKPHPNFVGVGKELDEESFARHIEKTLQAASGCAVEFIFRDIMTIEKNQEKPGRAVALTRKLIAKYY